MSWALRHPALVAVSVALVALVAAAGVALFVARSTAQVGRAPQSPDIDYMRLLSEATRRGRPESISGDWTFSGQLRITRGAATGYVLTSTDANGELAWATVPPAAITSVNATALPTYIVADSASVDSTARVTSMATHTLYAPVVAGLYRVSVLQEVTTAGAAGSLVTTIAWTDDNGAQTATPAASLVLTAQGYDEGSQLIRVASGSITYKADVSGVVGSPVYSVFVRLERP